MNPVHLPSQSRALTFLICGTAILISEPVFAVDASSETGIPEVATEEPTPHSQPTEQTAPNSEHSPPDEEPPSETSQSDQQNARLHFAEGLSHLRNNNYQLALEEFLAAQSLAPHPSVLFNIARVYEELYQLEQAIEYYSAYVDGSAPEASPLKRTQAERALHRLRNALERRQKATAAGARGAPSVPLKISCPYPDFQVFINGHLQATSPLGGTILVPHDAATLTFTRPGYRNDTHPITTAGTSSEVSCTPSKRGQLPKEESGFLHLTVHPVSATVLINGEQTNTSDPVSLPRGRHMVEVTAPHHMDQTITVNLDSRFAEHQIALVPEESPAVTRDKRQVQKVVGATLGGVGVLLAGTAVGLYAWNDTRHRSWQTERDTISQEPNSAPDLAERQAQSNARLQSIQTVDTVTWATGIAAGAFVGAGVFTYFFKWNHGHGEVAVAPQHISFTSRW